MKDPSIAAFWLITMPEMVGGFKFDDEIKQKIWWEYQVYFQCFLILSVLGREYLYCIHNCLFISAVLRVFVVANLC